MSACINFLAMRSREAVEVEKINMQILSEGHEPAIKKYQAKRDTVISMHKFAKDAFARTINANLSGSDMKGGYKEVKLPALHMKIDKKTFIDDIEEWSTRSQLCQRF